MTDLVATSSCQIHDNHFDLSDIVAVTNNCLQIDYLAGLNNDVVVEINRHTRKYCVGLVDF